MSFMHFDSTSATGEQTVVDLQDAAAIATSTTTASALLEARSDGRVRRQVNGSYTTLYNWIEPSFRAPGSPAYQIKRGASAPFDLNTGEGAGYGPLAGVWTEVGSSAHWGFAYSIVASAVSTFDVSIRQGTGPVIDVAEWTISINRTAAVGGGGGGGGCFTGNMLVLMADGTEKPIADILMGDMVMSLNTETNQLEGARVYSTMVPRICNIYKIKLSNGKTVETTIEHPFRTADGRWANIDPTATYQPTLGGKNVTPSYVDAQLHEGMLLRGAEGSAKITKIIDTGRIETVYHLSRVGTHRNFFVEGMCVHNISQEDVVKN